MKEENHTENDDEQKKSSNFRNDNDLCSALYGLGMIGAVVYFISTATSFWTGVYGVFKALVWPAFLVYYALRALGA